jgi:Orsellinic acid/F9775 biosynthesis cluster protein D
MANTSLTLPSILKDYFRLNNEKLILMCYHCQNAILPTALEYHLRTKIHANRETIRIAKDFATRLPQYTTETLPLQEDSSIPIENWPIYNGFQCRLCSFRSRSKVRVSKHATKEHDLRKTPESEKLQHVKLQSWFSDNRAKYWLVGERRLEQVVEERMGSSEVDLIEKERLRVEKEEEGRKIIQEARGQDTTDWWLKRTGWQELFAGRNLLLLSKTTTLPSTDEPHLLLICEAFDRIVQRCLQTLKETPRQVLCWLHSAKAETPHMRPFTVPEAKDTLTKYCRHWKSFLACLFRILEIEKEIQDQEYGIRYNQQTEQYATAVLLLAKELLNEEISAEERTAQLNKLSQRLMQLCIEILRHRYRTGDIYENPLLFFTAVLGIDQQKLMFRRPETYTSYLAGLVWINRLLLLEFALPQHAWTGLDWPDRTAYEDYGHRIREIHATHLAVGSFSPQSEILSLLAYGMRVAKEQGSRTVITWSLDGQTAWFNGSPI